MAKKKHKTRTSQTVHSSRAVELEELYRDLGFEPSKASIGSAASGNKWFTPVSFLPHVDYTISSVIGGY